MAGGTDLELVDGGSLAVEVSLSEPSPEPVQSPESPDGFVHVESSRDGIDGDLGESSDNQELRSLSGDEDDMGVAEDLGKEDMFVDCPDELVGNVDGREAISATETEENSEEYIRDDLVTGYEGEHLRTTLDRTEEREALSREILSLRHHLKALINQERSLDVSGGQEDKDYGFKLIELVNECSQIVQSAREERLQTEATVSELQAIVLAKNQEIDELNLKVAGFPVLDIEMVTNRLLAYYTAVVDPQELVDDSICGKLVFVERGTYMLAERYNIMLYEIDQLRQCFSGENLDFGSLDLGTFFASARGEVLELKRKELELVEKISHLERENRKVIQQLDDQKLVIERLNAELGKTKMELEQEKTRSSNIKEKLTMAVTKGKSLVQQRDALKQSLAEKMGELEKCMLELQEKSNYLEAAELQKEELIRTESSIALLQETLLQRNSALEKFEEMMAESDIPEELLSMDVVQRCRWLIDEYSELKGLSVEFNKVKDALSLIPLPETISSAELESQVHWVRNSLDEVKSEFNTMQDVFATAKVAAEKEIDHLTGSLLAELRTKDYLQAELDDLQRKYEEIVKKAHQLSLEKNHFVKMLLEASGLAREDEGISQTSSDLVMLIERCLGVIKEHSNASFGSSCVNTNLFEKLQSYLYVRTQELTLCELVLEEDMPVRSQLNNLSDELRTLSQELAAVKEENESLQSNLERSEEKSVLVREKLTMAVKKGKGLVQDREKLKLQLDEKNSEIEKSRLQFQEKESELAESKDKITGLYADIERIPSLEMDLAAIKQQRDQLEGFLLESNNILQRVIRSIDAIVLPADLVFEEPVDKVKWLAGFINECHDAKESMEKELASVREEVSTVSGKLIHAEATVQSLEDKLSEVENNVSHLAEEKTEIEIAKNNVEQELQKAREEASLHAGRFAEVSESRRSLEEALSHTKNNIESIFGEKESALASRAATESELEQVREEIATQTTKLTEAYKTIKSLEDALSQVQTDVNSLTEQNNDAEFQRTNLETELKKLQEEVESQAGKLEAASATIKSLEDALLKAENDVSVLVTEKKRAEEDMFTLNSRLNAYVEEAAGTNRSLENRSSELAGCLYDLQVLINDDTLLFMLKAFEAKFDSLRNMDNILEHIRDHFLGLGLEELQSCHVVEEDVHAAKSISACLGNIFTPEKYTGDVGAEDGDHISSYRKVVEGFQLRNKAVAENFDRFSSFVDGFIAALLRKLQATRGEVVVVLEYIESLKQKVNNLEIYKQEQSNTIALIENDTKTLLSACTDATKELHFEVKNSFLDLCTLPELEQHRHIFSPGIGEIGEFSTQEGQQSVEGSRYGDVAEMLLLASGKAKALCKQLESTTDVAVSMIVDLQNNLKEARTVSEKAIEESDQKQKMVAESVSDIETLQNSSSELRFAMEDCQAMEVELKEREAEVEALQHTCSELKLIIEDYQDMKVKLHEKEAEVQALHNSCRKLEFLGDEYRSMEVKLKEKEAKVEALQQSCLELRLTLEEYQAKEAKLKERDADVETLQHTCIELRCTIQEYQAQIAKLKERDEEVSTLYDSLLMREQAAEHSLLSESQVKTLFDKIREIDIPMAESKIGDLEPQNSLLIKRLFYIIDNFNDLQHQISSLTGEKEKLQSTLRTQVLEIQLLKEEIANYVRDHQSTEEMKNEQSQVIFSLERIIDMLGGSSSLVTNRNSSDVKGPLSVLEKKAMSLLSEYEISKSKAQDLGSKLSGSEKIVDELSARVKLLEDSLQAKASQPEIHQARSSFEGPSLPTDSEISEIEDVGKSTISPIPLAAQMRTTRKGSTEHLALDIDLESSRLINNEQTNEDKGHVFKSLNTSGIVPKQGKMIADRIDGIWVSGGRILMSRPRARIGVIAYCLLLHIWVLATIL